MVILLQLGGSGMLFFYFYLLKGTGGIIDPDDHDHEMIHFVSTCVCIQRELSAIKREELMVILLSYYRLVFISPGSTVILMKHKVPVEN